MFGNNPRNTLEFLTFARMEDELLLKIQRSSPVLSRLGIIMRSLLIPVNICCPVTLTNVLEILLVLSDTIVYRRMCHIQY